MDRNLAMGLNTVERKMSQLGDVVLNKDKIAGRFKAYFYAILILSALIFARTAELSRYLLILPILYFIILTPTGKSIEYTLSIYKNNSILLLLCTISNQTIHYISGGSFFDHPLLILFTLIVSSFIFLDSMKMKSLSAENETSDGLEQIDSQQIQDLYHELDNVMLTALFAALMFGVKVEPKALFVEALLLYFDFFIVRKVAGLRRGKQLVRAAQAAVLLAAFVRKEYYLPESDSIYNWARNTISVTAVLFTALFAIQWALLGRLDSSRLPIFPEVQYCYRTAYTPEYSVKHIEQYQNTYFILSHSWSLLIPFPALLALFSSSIYMDKGAELFQNWPNNFQDIACIFLVTTLILTMLASPSNKTIRSISCSFAGFVIFVAWIHHLYLQKDDQLRTNCSILCLGCLFFVYKVSEFYNIADRVFKDQIIGAPRKLQFTGLTARILNPLIGSWITTSSFVSAFFIFILSALYQPHFLFKLVAAFWIGMFPEVKAGFSYSMLSSIVLVELTWQMFLENASDHGPVFSASVLGNLAVLIISEMQRLRYIGSMYPLRKDVGTEEVEYSDNWLMRTVKTAINSINGFSTFVLLGLLLFNPQMAQITLQTSTYTLWTGFFVYLFYRPEKTAKLRIFAIRILALISAVFFLYNWANIDAVNFNNWKNPPEVYLIIHAAVFWLSCASFFGHHILKNKEMHGQKASVTDVYDDQSAKAPISEIKIFLQRLFVLYWTRLCALLAFVSAFLSPCCLGIGHILIGCVLVFQSVLSPQLYVPLIIWLEISIFAPAITFQFFNKSHTSRLIEFIVGKHNSFMRTVCLTAWALILFLQPLFIELLERYAREEDREYRLVSFRILPEDKDDTGFTTGTIESFENSFRYYLSCWFIEFHDELMIAAFATASISNQGFLGLLYALLAIIQVGSSRAVYLKAVATLSLIFQVSDFITRYILHGLAVTKLIVISNTKWNTFFGIIARPKMEDPDSIAIWNGSLSALFIFLTIRWYLTRYYCTETGLVRRFDSHWCRLCGSVSKKTQHGYSRIKQSVHLYLGWFSHIVLFFASVLAFSHQTVPVAILLLQSLMYFFFGETALLSPTLRAQVSTALFVIFAWILTKPVYALASLYLSLPKERSYAYYLGVSHHVAFPGFWPKGLFGLSVFLLLIQRRLHASTAFPYVMARLYQSIANSAKRGKLYFLNLHGIIEFQQKNLKRAMEHVQAQLSAFTEIDISDWKKLCYQAPGANVEDRDACEEGTMPEYGEYDVENYEVGSSNDEDGKETKVHKSIAIRYRQHLSKLHARTFSDDTLDDISASSARSEISEKSRQSEHNSRKERLELEKNFYLYTLILCGKIFLKTLLNSASEYRVVMKRPPNHVIINTVFRKNSNMITKVKCILELLLDLFHAHFDLVLDCLVMDAHMFHGSGFSTVLVFSVLLLSHMQRPFTSNTINNYMMLFTCVWLLTNYFISFEKLSVLDMRELAGPKKFDIPAAAKALLEMKNYSFTKDLFNRLVGLHQHSRHVEAIKRPTLILLALSYKRNIMRYLGLWHYSSGLRMARAYFQNEDDITDQDLDHVDLSEKEYDSSEESDDDLSMDSAESEFELELKDQDHHSFDSFTEYKDDLQPKSVLEIFSPVTRMPWKDFYAIMFAADFTCMLFAFYYWGDFMLGPGSNNNDRIFWDMINHNLIPRSLVKMLVFNTFMLLVDRALYVSKNYTGKIIMQFSTVIIFHWYVFFHLPMMYSPEHKHGMHSLFGVRLWYASKWIYWIASALQLRYSYPPLRTEVFLSSTFNIFAVNLRTISKNIPFIEELRTIVDWAVTPSALGVWAWLKLADIYDRLYAVQCARAFQRSYYGRHTFGDRLNQLNKYGQGVAFLIIFVFILWSPFLILSQPNVMVPNEIESMSLSIGVKGYGSVFASFTSTDISNVSEDQYGYLKKEKGVNAIEVDQSFFSRVKFPMVSQTEDSSSRQNRMKLIKDLLDLETKNRPMKLSLTWQITRKVFQDVPTVHGNYNIELNAKGRATLAAMLEDCEPSSREEIELELTGVAELVDAPLKGFSHLMGRISDGLRLVKKCSDKKDPSVQPHFKLVKFSGSKMEDWEWFVYSAKLPKYNFSSFNLIGLYATVVLAIAQLLRLIHSDMTTRIPLDELPNPMPLLNMCRQILMVREMGDYESEEAIYWQLIEILRNPNLLIEMTKLN